MYDDHAFQLGLDQNKTMALTTQPAATEPLLFAETAQPNVKLGSNVLVLVPFGLVAVWTIALVYFQQAKQQPTGLSRTRGRRPLNQLPCRSCVFFKNNPYLKCAINPMDALTQKAIDCMDYTPNSQPQPKR